MSPACSALRTAKTGSEVALLDRPFSCHDVCGELLSGSVASVCWLPWMTMGLSLTANKALPKVDSQFQLRSERLSVNARQNFHRSQLWLCRPNRHPSHQLQSQRQNNHDWATAVFFISSLLQ